MTAIDWMAGYCHTMRDENNLEIVEYMLDYVIHLLDHAADFSWAVAKASHAVLLCRMEQYGIASWKKVDKTDGE